MRFFEPIFGSLSTLRPGTDPLMAQLQKKANAASIRQKLIKAQKAKKGCLFYSKVASIWLLCLLVTSFACFFVVWLGETNYKSFAFICTKRTGKFKIRI